MCGSQSEDNDLLWTITSDAFPFHKQLSETHVSFGDMKLVCIITTFSDGNNYYRIVL